MSYQAVNYLKTHNKFYEDIFISEGLSSKKMIIFSGIDEHEDVTESIHKKIISNKTEYGSVGIRQVCTELDQMKQPSF